MSEDSHRRVVLGVELESYTIVAPEYSVVRELAFPRKGVGEAGERFARDASIGTEYNSRPFSTVREGFFLLKAGLRKYNKKLYRSQSKSRRVHHLLLVGGWRDRFAGAHIHISLNGKTLDFMQASRIAWHLHDHIPFLIALGANSPIWADELTTVASTRISRASRSYFKAIRRNELHKRPLDEMTFNRGRKTKPPTLEVRVLDSNIPEFVMAAATVIKAAVLGWQSGRKASNRINHADYLLSRKNAAERGMRSKLCWNGEWIPAARYLDRFVWFHRDEFRRMDIPQELWTTYRLLKKGWNGSAILLAAARGAYDEHPQSWQRRFAKRYASAIDSLLSGNDILDFARRLHVDLPQIDDVWVGRRRRKLILA